MASCLGEKQPELTNTTAEDRWACAGLRKAGSMRNRTSLGAPSRGTDLSALLATTRDTHTHTTVPNSLNISAL